MRLGHDHGRNVSISPFHRRELLCDSHTRARECNALTQGDDEKRELERRRNNCVLIKNAHEPCSVIMHLDGAWRNPTQQMHFEVHACVTRVHVCVTCVCMTDEYEKVTTMCADTVAILTYACQQTTHTHCVAPGHAAHYARATIEINFVSMRPPSGGT